MNQFGQLDQLIEEHGGTIQTSQVLEVGASKPAFYTYVREKGLERTAHGIYVSPGAWTDAMYLLHLRCGQIVFSHETALFFHDLTDRRPLKYSTTAKTNYSPSRLREDGVRVYIVRKKLHGASVTTAKTPFGRAVPVYDMGRTICDLLRSRSRMEIQMLQDALKQYARRKDKNLRMLMQYVAVFHIEEMLRQCSEVLL